MHLPKRVLLLGTAVAAFGAILASGVIANPTGSANTTNTFTVGVDTPDNLSATLSTIATEVAANGTAQKVADIEAAENDPNYNVEATSASVTDQGTNAGTCTSISATPFSVSGFTAVGDLDSTGSIVAELDVTLPVTVNNNCTVSDAVVTVNFQAIGGSLAAD